MKRKQYSTEVEPGKEVKVAGWTENIRVLGGIIFVSIRDRTGTIQITLPKKKVSEELFEKASDLNQETVIAVKGKSKSSDQAPGGIEIIPSKIEVLSESEKPLPMDISGKIDSELETRLNERFMDLRKNETKAIFMLRNSILTGIRDYLEEEGFVEVHTPKIVSAGAEGGATLFQLEYFDKKAYLTQSPQLFKQTLMATGLDRVYEIGPAFRAEKSHTTKHISEFTSFDFEMSFIESQEEVMEVIEDCLAYTIEHVKENEEEYLEILGLDPEVPETPFRRISFKEAQEMLSEKGKEIEVDLDTEAEKMLGEEIEEEFYFITNFPSEDKPFYIMEEEDSKYSCSFDLDYRGIEIASGGQREHRYDVLTERMEEQGLKPEDFDFYLNSFKYGMPPHGGIGVGLDRVVQKFLNLSNVREAVLFPRDQERLEP